MKLTERQIKLLKWQYNDYCNGNCCVSSIRNVLDILDIDIELIEDDAYSEYDYDAYEKAYNEKDDLNV